MKVVQIGYGHLGKWHAEKALITYKENFIGIVEVDESKHEELNHKFPHQIITNNLEDIIKKADAVIIVTPTSFHYELLKKCLERDLHVFCEKPLTESYPQTVEINDILNKRPDLKLQVGHSERFHPVWDQLRSELKEKEVFSLIRRAPFKGRGADVDIVQDLMIHDFDLLFYFLGKAPKSIDAIGTKVVTENYDYVRASLDFGDGQSAEVVASRISTNEQRQMLAVDKKGEVLVDLLSAEFSRSYFDEGEFIVQKSKYDRADHLLEEHQHFKKLIDTNSEPIVGIKDAVIVMKMIDMTVRSLISGERVFWQ